MAGNHVILHTISFLAVMIGLIGICAGAGGYSWWKLEKLEIGLWRTCTDNSNCFNRENILEFEEKDKEIDIILIILIISAFFTLIAFIAACTMFCCLKQAGMFKCGSVFTALLTLLGGASALGACIYAEIEFEDNWKHYDHGWSVIAAWIGGVACMLSFILSIVLSCINIDREERQYYQEDVRPTYDTQFNNKSFNSQHNQGYQRN